MNFRDTLVTCQSCGKQFVFTVEAQRSMADRDQEIRIPGMCDACTQRIKFGGKLHGRIKWFSMEKGYGFIIADSGSDIFVHRNSILQDEDGFMDSLPENCRQRAWDLLRDRAGDIDAFVPVSRFYGRQMGERLGLDKEKIHVVHTGIEPDRYPARQAPPDPPAIAPRR